MNTLKNKDIWIIGFGGIAQAIAKKLSDNKITVFTTNQKLKAETYNNINIQIFNDYSECSIKEFITKNTFQELPDYIIITCGKLHTEAHMPEKTIMNFEKDWLMENIESNMLPHAYFTKYLSSKMKKSSKIIMACFSARVGSITDNKYGGWHSYRISKSMLNMLVKNISLEWKIKSPESVIFTYHPGTVDSKLSKPFHKSIGSDQLFTPDQAADYFLNVLKKADPIRSGLLFDWQGMIINF